MPPLPLYVRLKDALLKEISEGRLRPGDRLPTEDELIRAHRVSRVTVRQALNLLRDQGLIERFARRGSFVKDRPTGSAWTASSMEDVLSVGAQTVPEHLEWDVVHAPAAARRLRIPPTEKLYRLRSVRCHGGAPVYCVEAYVPLGIGRRLCRDDLRQAILLQVVEATLGIPIASGLEEISAGVTDRSLARRLGVPPGAPVLILDMTYFGVDGRPIEYAKAWYRGDQFRRRNLLTRGPSPADRLEALRAVDADASPDGRGTGEDPLKSAVRVAARR